MYTGPHIITSGLILNLDAANTKSYNGTTTWYGQVNNDINCTLVNSITYSSNNKGYLIFNGTNQYSTITNNSSFDMSTGDFTIDIWVSPSSFSNACTLFGQGTALNGLSIGFHTNGKPYISLGCLYNSVAEGSNLYLTPPNNTVFTSILYAGYGVNNGIGPNYIANIISPTSRSICETAYIGFSPNVQVGTSATNAIFGDPINGTPKTLALTVSYGLFSSQSMSINTWNNIIATRIGTELYLYLNSILVGQMTYSTTVGSSTSTNLIGSNIVASTNCLYYNGKLSNIRIYKDKGLSSTEVLQNYVSFKNRFI